MKIQFTKLSIFMAFSLMLAMFGLHAQPVEYTLKKGTEAPTVDGDVDPIWNQIEAKSLDVQFNEAAPSATDLSATFKALYHGTKLYVLIEATDDVLITGFINNDTINPEDLTVKQKVWETDAYSFYFLHGDSQEGDSVQKWVDSTGHWLRFKWGLPWSVGGRVNGSWKTMEGVGKRANPEASALLSEYTNKISGNSYIAEFSLDVNTWTYGVVQEFVKDDVFTAEFQLDDSDGGGSESEPSGRKNQIYWAAIDKRVGGAPKRTSGRFIVSDEEVEPIIASTGGSKLIEAKLYPNPAHSFVSLKNAKTAKIMTLQGQTMLFTNQTSHIDLSSFKPGIYGVLIDGVSMQRLIIK